MCHHLYADLSKYGTYVDTTPEPTFQGPALGAGSPAVRVPPTAMIRFGYKSPFKLYHQASENRMVMDAAGRQAGS